MDTNHKQPMFPWYKERLQNKYGKSATNKLSFGSCWRYVNVSLDDSGPALSGTKSSVSPVMFHATPNHTSSQVLKKTSSKEHACFSKQMIQKQIRKEYVESVERKLTQHPLALYPHYKDNMSPELFDKVLSALEPDLCSDSTSGGLPLGPAEEEDEEHSTEPNQKEGTPAKDKCKRGKYKERPEDLEENDQTPIGTLKSQQLPKLNNNGLVSLDEETTVTKRPTTNFHIPHHQFV